MRPSKAICFTTSAIFPFAIFTSQMPIPHHADSAPYDTRSLERVLKPATAKSEAGIIASFDEASGLSRICGEILIAGCSTPAQRILESCCKSSSVMLLCGRRINQPSSEIKSRIVKS